MLQLSGELRFVWWSSVVLALSACPQSLVRFPESVDGSVQCGAGTSACEGVCVSLRDDDANCGACGASCGRSERCLNARCERLDCTEADCSSAQVCLEEHCRDADCQGSQCPQGQGCYLGECLSSTCSSMTCPAGHVCVNDTCVDPSCAGVRCLNGGQCDDGVCVVTTCVQGGTCSPEVNPCHVGSIICDGGAQLCADKPINVATGTACGDAGVCNNGTCVTCNAGAACDTVNPCHVGAISCSLGAPSCVDSTVPKADGTACGGGLICQQGACVACQEDAGCQPGGNACHEGHLSCAAGAVCNDSNVALDAGTTCGTDKVCDSAGACVPCRAGVGCAIEGAPCEDGVISCSSGAAVCLSQNSKPAGSLCDGGVCNTTGQCAPCSNGVSCTPSVCNQGTISCGSAGATCTNPTPVANGSACDGGVCFGGGCVACVTDAPCTGNPNPGCRNGKSVCSAAGKTCVDGTAKTGQACTNSSGVSGICSAAGACDTCAAVSCSGNPNDCYNGIVSCPSGSCVNNTVKGAGATCSAGQCNGSGACVSCNATCTTNSNDCKNGTVSCPTGACVDGSNKSAGATCSGGQCNGSGVCVSCNATCTGNTTECKNGTVSCPTGACVDGSNKGAGTACTGGQCDGSGTCVPTVTGACGSANGTSTLTAPTTGFCTTGTPTAVTGTGPWSWSCTGAGGGMSALCSAPVTAASCGTAEGTTRATAPSGAAVLCAVGSASAVSGTTLPALGATTGAVISTYTWSWTCATAGGTANCSANITQPCGGVSFVKSIPEGGGAITCQNDTTSGTASSVSVVVGKICGDSCNCGTGTTNANCEGHVLTSAVCPTLIGGVYSLGIVRYTWSTTNRVYQSNFVQQLATNDANSMYLCLFPF